MMELSIQYPSVDWNVDWRQIAGEWMGVRPRPVIQVSRFGSRVALLRKRIPTSADFLHYHY